jgi:apolipoprotein N-acyltransferase
MSLSASLTKYLGNIKQPYIFWLPIAGLLQTISLAPLDIWPAGILSITLILHFLYRLPKSRGGFYGWLFGLGLFGSGASWVYVSIHTFGYTPIPLAVALTILFVMLLALFPALVFKLFLNIAPDKPLEFTLVFSAMFVIGDLFRGWFLTGFPWLYLGYSDINTPLSGWAPIIGIHGLTFITLLSGSSVWLFIKARSKYLRTISIFGIFVLALWAIGFLLKGHDWAQPASGEALTVATIQANIPQTEKWSPTALTHTLDTYSAMTNEVWNKDIIIWPETAIPALLQQVPTYLKNINKKAIESNTAFFTGIPNGLADKNNRFRVYNSILGLGEASGIYNKQKLVPFGEYIPLEDWLRGLIHFFDLPMSNFSKGQPNQPLLKARGHLVAPYICYELVYPDFVAKRAYEADYLVSISNDSWFGHSWGPLQHLQMARMRALENARYLIRATNNGVSAIINDQGQIQSRSPQFKAAILKGTVIALKGRTPFSYMGSIPIFLISLLIITFFSRLIIRRPS